MEEQEEEFWGEGRARKDWEGGLQICVRGLIGMYPPTGGSALWC